MKIVIRKTVLALIFILTVGWTVASAEEIPRDMSGAEVYKQFKEKLSFMVDNEDDYKTYYTLNMYGSELAKKSFIDKEDLNNTEETWNGMSIFEKFAYDALYLKPYRALILKNSTTLKEFLSHMEDEFVFLSDEKNGVPKGETIRQSINSVWVWLWSNWEEKGILLNIFTDEALDGGKVKEELEQAEQRDVEEAQRDVTEAVGEDSLDWDEIPTYEEGEGAVPEDEGSFDAKKNTPKITDFIITLVLIAIISAVGFVLYRVKKKNEGGDTV